MKECLLGYKEIVCASWKPINLKGLFLKQRSCMVLDAKFAHIRASQEQVGALLKMLLRVRDLGEASSSGTPRAIVATAQAPIATPPEFRGGSAQERKKAGQA